MDPCGTLEGGSKGSDVQQPKKHAIWVVREVRGVSFNQ